LEDSGATAKLVWPTLLEIARPAREKRRLEPDARDRLFLDLCSKASLSVRELAQLVDRTEAYVGDAIRPLIDSRLLTFLYPDQPRHPRQRYITTGSPAEAEVRSAAEQAAPDERTSIPDVESPKEGPASLIWAELERIAEPARDKKRLAPPVRDELVVALCSRAPLSVRELAALLSRTEAYISDAIQPLVAAGRLSFLYPDQPRHPKQRYVAPWSDGNRLEAALDREHAPDPAARFHPPVEEVVPAAAVEEAVTPPVDASPAVALPAAVRSSPAQERPWSERTQTPIEQPAFTSSEPAISEPNGSVLNAWTSPILAGIIGLVLGAVQVNAWVMYAVLGSALLAILHLLTGSSQLRRYRALNPARSATIAFLVLKSLFAFTEIVLAYLVMNYFLNGA
jgi:predicted transcriptional regulator